MKTKRAGFLTKVVVLALLIAAAVALLNQRELLQQAQADRDALAAQVEAQIQINADLADAVEHSEDPDRQADIAREKFGLVEPGEQIIYFTE